MAGAVPKYRLIADSLLKDIADGKLPVGTMLPTENELMRAFGVSRATVRKATSSLNARGVVSSRQGQGSKVISQERPSRFVTKIQSIEELLAYAQVTAREFIASRRIEADGFLAEQFRCAGGKRLLEVQLLRRDTGGDSRPLVYVTIWTDALFENVVSDLQAKDRPVAELILDRFGYDFQQVVQVTSAAPMSAVEAKLLDRAPGQPALVILRRYSAQPGMPPHLVSRSVSHWDDVQIVSHFQQPAQ